MKKYYCKDCSKEIDKRGRSTYCHKCKYKHFKNPMKDKHHTKETKELIGKKSKEKFTDEYVEKFQDKNKGKKHKSVNGYILIKNYTHQNRNSHNEILEHILVMSKHINRPLTKSEIVHHIDGDRTNNKIENLYLYKNRKEHQEGHHSINKLIKVLLDKNIVKFKDGQYVLKEVIK